LQEAIYNRWPTAKLKTHFSKQDVLGASCFRGWSHLSWLVHMMWPLSYEVNTMQQHRIWVRDYMFWIFQDLGFDPNEPYLSSSSRLHVFDFVLDKECDRDLREDVLCLLMDFGAHSGVRTWDEVLCYAMNTECGIRVIRRLLDAGAGFTAEQQALFFSNTMLYFSARWHEVHCMYERRHRVRRACWILLGIGRRSGERIHRTIAKPLWMIMARILWMQRFD